ncbi:MULTISPECIES: hypothetical protein [Clostridium]|uniref:Uncharacterized protein n=1 Tax=Clostridium sporogenes TaxID=1509 RepID=A0AAE4JTX7_CLOSG|nr:hypothetical protein [Clostridium sporogenes]MDS1004491.1 hypothetical protein [Clostridium sporogenes]
MKVVLNFIVFMILIMCVEKIIEKTNIHLVLINKIKKYKHYKTILFILLIIIGLIVDLATQSLNVRFGKHNIPCIVLGAIILGIYLELFPYIFSKKHLD